MSTEYVIGIIVGLLITVAVVVVCKKAFMGRRKMKYDERQKVVQGNACKYAFYYLLVFNIIYACACSYIDFSELGGYIMTSGTLVSVVVYAVYCIWKEAYFPINQSSMKWVLIILIIGLINLALGLLNYENEMNSSVFINFACAVMCIVVSVASYIKLKLSIGNSGEEDL